MNIPPPDELHELVHVGGPTAATLHDHSLEVLELAWKFETLLEEVAPAELLHLQCSLHASQSNSVKRLYPYWTAKKEKWKTHPLDDTSLVLAANKQQLDEPS